MGEVGAGLFIITVKLKTQKRVNSDCNTVTALQRDQAKSCCHSSE